MDYQASATTLHQMFIDSDRRWIDLPIWPRTGRTTLTAGHAFLSEVLSLIGDDEVKFVSWSSAGEGSFVATAWTATHVVQGVCSGTEGNVVTTIQKRSSLKALRVHAAPLLSMSGFGISTEEPSAGLEYPEFSAVLRMRNDDTFLTAIESLRDDLA